MRKVIMFAVLVCFSIVLMGDNQRTKTSKTDINNARGSRFAECLEGAVFSQIFELAGATHFSGAAPREVANQYSASGPFQSIRFWWWDPHQNLSDDNIFTIIVYDGPPNDPGTLVLHTTSQTGTISLVEDAPVDYIYRIDLGLTEALDIPFGWIGISAYNPNLYIYHVSFFKHVESGLTPLMYFDGSWLSYTNSNNLLCLGAKPAPIPLSNHALYLSIFMIGLFITVKVRSRMI